MKQRNFTGDLSLINSIYFDLLCILTVIGQAKERSPVLVTKTLLFFAQNSYFKVMSKNLVAPPLFQIPVVSTHTYLVESWVSVTAHDLSM